MSIEKTTLGYRVVPRLGAPRIRAIIGADLDRKRGEPCHAMRFAVTPSTGLTAGWSTGDFIHFARNRFE